MPEIRKILLLGGGGHCRSVLDSLMAMSCFSAIGIVDKKCNSTTIPIVGEDSDLERLYADGYTDAFITVGSIGDVTIRRRLYEHIKQIGFYIPNIIDITSVVSPSADLGEGIFVGKKAVINADARIGNCAIINTTAVIEHECRIGDFVHVATGSILCGNVSVDNGTHIGAGSVIKQGVHIGTNTMIGMGSVVLKDMGSEVTAYGNPCKEVNHE